MEREMDIQVDEAQRIPHKLNLNNDTPRHIIIKLSRVKKNNFKSKKRREVIYKGDFIRLFVDCSTEIS